MIFMSSRVAETQDQMLGVKHVKTIVSEAGNNSTMPVHAEGKLLHGIAAHSTCTSFVQQLQKLTQCV